jgi:hypothetical protein
VKFLVVFFAATTQFCLWCDLLGVDPRPASPKLFVIMGAVQAGLLAMVAVAAAFDRA